MNGKNSVKELAKWFFEEDLKNGCLDVSRWKDLSNKEKEEYMTEAKFYFKKEKVNYSKVKEEDRK